MQGQLRKWLRGRDGCGVGRGCSNGPEQMLGGPRLGELWKLAKDWAVALPRKPEKWPEVAS